MEEHSRGGIMRRAAALVLVPASFASVVAIVGVCFFLSSGPATEGASWKPFSQAQAPGNAATLASTAAIAVPGTSQGLVGAGDNGPGAPKGRAYHRRPEERKDDASKIDNSVKQVSDLVRRTTMLGDEAMASRRTEASKSDPAILSKGFSAVGDAAAEEFSIKPRNIPFRQGKGDWQRPGHGISITAKGEPKSGTTWLGRLMPQLALELCGSESNTWCKMGGLVVFPNEPSPWYEFEMIKGGAGGGGSPELFLHFKGNWKHYITGMIRSEAPKDCTNGGRKHRNFFEDDPPCLSSEPPTRERLRACLWETSNRCLNFNPTADVRRTAVIMRDPRNIVLSERKMRVDYYHHQWVEALSIEEFVRQRFETLVSWIHQRWVWHTDTIMRESSHVMIYEDLQESHEGMIDLAAFMGLACSEEEARRVWQSHQHNTTHGGFATSGLLPETLEWMNATMAKLLPVPLALRWGVTPTDL